MRLTTVLSLVGTIRSPRGPPFGGWFHLWSGSDDPVEIISPLSSELRRVAGDQARSRLVAPFLLSLFLVSASVGR